MSERSERYEKILAEFETFRKQAQANAELFSEPPTGPMTPTDSPQKPTSIQKGPAVDNLDDARYWIRVLWRYAVQDADGMNDLRERVRALEAERQTRSA